MQFNLFCCWDCGNRIIDGEPGRYHVRPTYRRVRFELADGSYMEPGFCQTCAERPWTPDRFRSLEWAIGTTAKSVNILSYTRNYALSEPVSGVFGAR